MHCVQNIVFKVKHVTCQNKFKSYLIPRAAITFYIIIFVFVSDTNWYSVFRVVLGSSSELVCQGTDCLWSFHFHLCIKYQSLSHTWKKLMISHHLVSKGIRPGDKHLCPGPSGPFRSSVGFIHFYDYIRTTIKLNFPFKMNHPSCLWLCNVVCKQTTKEPGVRVCKITCKSKHSWPWLNDQAIFLRSQFDIHQLIFFSVPFYLITNHLSLYAEVIQT